MDYQQHPHRYVKPPPPPPPSMADPHHQPPLRQPLPPPAPWYSGQFQYQPPPSQHSPSPPPPHHQWAPPPPHSDHLHPPYAAPPPYPAHPLHNQYHAPPPPHRPPLAPSYHPHSQIPQSYPQEWGNANWIQHQGWEYPAAHHNEEDWAAKARAWAAAKSATENQHSQSQFAPVGRLEEPTYYHDQYPQTSEPHYHDIIQPSLPASGYQQYPPPAAPPHKPPIVHLQESVSIGSGQSSFVPDEHLAYSARDGNSAVDSSAVFPHQESSPTSSSVHLQEVPSSYSTVTGKEEAGDQNEKFYKSFPLSIDSSQGLQHVHPPPPSIGRSSSTEMPHYAIGNQSAETPTDLRDQPLEFAHRYNHVHDPIMQPTYAHSGSMGPIRGVDPIVAAPSNHAWPPAAAPGVVYPPTPPVLQSGQQHDPSLAMPSPVTGISAPLFGRMPGPSFQPTIASVGAPFGIGTGSALHPTAAFSGDGYGISSVSERPKKASVPNWLREEIIKKKAVIANSASELPREETGYIEDEAVDKSLGKADQADSKSIDSSKSTEEEDEDYVEAARTAAINQEIKRILTEVLLKVTDELFDEIATKVLNEDELTVEVDQNVVTPNCKTSPSTPAVPTPKASAKVLIPGKAKGTENEEDGGKSSSSSPGDVLGLANYGSDDDEDDEKTVHQQLSTRKLSEDKHAVENGSLQAETGKHNKGLRNVEGDTSMIGPNGATIHQGTVNELRDNRGGRRSSDGSVGSRYSSEMVSGTVEDEDKFDGEKRPESVDASRPDHSVQEDVMKTELPIENISAKKSSTENSRGRETRNKQDKSDKRETKRNSAGKDVVKEVDSGKDRIDDREDESCRRQDERHVKRERTDNRNGSKENTREHGGKSGDKARDSDSRKRSIHPDVKDDKKEKERDRRVNAKEDSDRRRERTKDEKGERSRHKLLNESSRHKRHRSSSVGSRGRNSKDNSVVSHANDSSGESSDDSKRKLHSKRRNLSPSPNRSRRRQDSRSPHSKHSQRRHSPYSSLENTRGRRSRSRSPVRRQR